MINFIKSEAKEKADEIELQTREDFAIEKQNLVEDGKKKIREDYNKKEQQVIIKKKIDHSNEIKSARLEILKLKEEILKDMVAEALEQIKKAILNKDVYKKLLHDLVLQAALRFLDSELNVYCREQDYELVASQMASVQTAYKNKTNMDVKITVQKKNYLAANAAGGVLVHSKNDLIKIDNTLEKRVYLCQEQKLPELRKMLYGDIDSRLV
ncbi:predicted protein [Naegleria gruberi]|uniref:Predicted protein n=1 Tax=Naegleria gruberi TaxID=5762 RepID=D2VRL4_NAEGR|nr:uncharacterized protein NAEGRDRAFT_71627 [Naegleria gruberi]EFC40482.1 predicted protein [Naegleria gruberi]|eukprot:XP_002673226.1 predicted protein [Naegleria gruberi strain NEG-M]